MTACNGVAEYHIESVSEAGSNPEIGRQFLKVFSGSNSEIGKLIFGHLGGSNSEIGKLIFELFRGSNGFQDFVDRRWIEWSEWIELDRIGSNWIERGSNVDRMWIELDRRIFGSKCKPLGRNFSNF